MNSNTWMTTAQIAYCITGENPSRNFVKNLSSRLHGVARRKPGCFSVDKLHESGQSFLVNVAEFLEYYTEPPLVIMGITLDREAFEERMKTIRFLIKRQNVPRGTGAQ